MIFILRWPFSINAAPPSTSPTCLQIRGFGFGDIFKDQLIKLRPRSLEVDSEGDKVSGGHAHSAKCSYLTDVVIIVLLLLRGRKFPTLAPPFSSVLAALQHRKWF